MSEVTHCNACACCIPLQGAHTNQSHLGRLADILRLRLPAAGITEDGKDSAAAMDNAYKWILIWGGILSVVLFILWPCLALPAKVFSKSYFTFWSESVLLFLLLSHPRLHL